MAVAYNHGAMWIANIQWQIQGFSDGRANLERRMLIILQKFCWKLHESEKIGHAPLVPHPLDPPIVLVPECEEFRIIHFEKHAPGHH